MKINEIEPEKKIVVSKFNFSCDDIDEAIPKPLPQSKNWFMLISGKPQSGKTNLLCNLITKNGKCYNKKYDKVYIFSPSLNTMKNDPFESIPEEQRYNELTPENLTETLNDISDTGEKVMLIFDDCVNDITKSAELKTIMNKIAMNRRHLCGEGGSVSIILTTQVLNKIPASIRKSASHLILFNTKNKREIDCIFDEIILIPKKDFYDIMKYVFDKKHNFLYLDINQDHNKMFHKNFNQLEFKTSDEAVFELEGN